MQWTALRLWELERDVIDAARQYRTRSSANRRQPGFDEIGVNIKWSARFMIHRTPSDLLITIHPGLIPFGVCFGRN